MDFFWHEWNVFPGLQIRVCDQKLIFLFLNQNICFGYSKEPSQWDGSFEHPKQMFKLIDKKILTFLLNLEARISYVKTLYLP